MKKYKGIIVSQQ